MSSYFSVSYGQPKEPGSKLQPLFGGAGSLSKRGPGKMMFNGINMGGLPVRILGML